MDIARPEFKRRKRRRQIALLAVLVVIAVLTADVFRFKPAAPTVERGTVWTDSVKRGSMLRQVRGIGALERVGMAHRLRHYPSQLSGGQQQRVAVARALAGHPSILLTDEPTGNLDSRNGEAVMELLGNLHKDGATICMVTHDPRFAKHAHREIHPFDGKVVAEEELKKLMAEVQA